MGLRNKRKIRKKRNQRNSSDSTLAELKISYDKQLQAHNELKAHLDDQKIPFAERENRIPEFKSILSCLNGLILRIGELGYSMTGSEVLEGFTAIAKLDGLQQKTSTLQISALTLPRDFELSDEFKECRDVIEQGKSLFITGEAGTGKSTLLAYWRQNTNKNYIVLAPTGIAAINCGGQTIHSFFKFPPTLVQKKDIRLLPRISQLLKRLEVLVVDEVSMMRSDLLDAIDYSLRINREIPNVPFGGVQIILVGDLYQLPPIVGKELEEHYLELYDTRYFFSANVFKEIKFHQFVLTKNYRQKDEKFMFLLNRVRNRTVADDDLRLLNSRVSLTLSESQENCVRLTPTNAAANAINQNRLEKLPGKEFLYEAVIEGDYDPKSYPTETHLKLKVGAQVIMVKNDIPGQRWVNGSIGEVVELNSDSVRVKIGHSIYDVTQTSWEKIIYRHDRQTNEIVSDIIGSFKQHPIRLAWAITIHKSQGQSFDRVIVDFDDGAFAHGQAYVALTRCRSFEGLILKRPIKYSDFYFDEQIHRVSEIFVPSEEKLPKA